MRLLSARLIISLFVGITVVSLLFSYYSVHSEEDLQLRSDLERRAELLGESLSANVEHALTKGLTARTCKGSSNGSATASISSESRSMTSPATGSQ